MLSEIIQNRLAASISLNSYMSPIAEKVVSLLKQIEIQSEGEFQKCCVRKKLKKGDYLLEQGQTTNRLWYLLEGIAHEYIQYNECKLTLSFVFPNVFIDYFPGTVGNLPAPRNIRLLTDAEIIEIDQERMMQIESIHKLVFDTRSMLIVFYNLELRERMLQLQFLNAHERYVLLLERQPHLIKKIPSIYLADYLGISAETLSRIRAKNLSEISFKNKSVTQYIVEKNSCKK